MMDKTSRDFELSACPGKSVLFAGIVEDEFKPDEDGSHDEDDGSSGEDEDDVSSGTASEPDSPIKVQ